MAQSFRIGNQISQKLTINQSLRQSIELLQLSNIELSDLITEEMETNPSLEELPQQSTESSIENVIQDEISSVGGSEVQRDSDRFNEDSDGSTYSYSQKNDDHDRSIIEQTVEKVESLMEHLLWQSSMTSTESKKDIFEDIITSLDDQGFLPENFNAGKYSQDDYESALKLIQLFDPIGCATTGVQQSLIIQAQHYYPQNTLIHDIIGKCFKELEHLDYDAISSTLHVTPQDVIAAVRDIHNLSPYPGNCFATTSSRYIMPDVEVFMQDGEVIIAPKDEWIPQLSVNSYYIDILKKKDIEKKQRDYIQDIVNSGRTFIHNISQRRNTILKVVTSIVKYQRGFIEKGPGHLQPLTHLDIAQDISMHESTISRVCSNKYVQTKWGLFELKEFFVSRLKNEDISSDEIKHKLKSIISKEDSEKPYSDEELSDILLKEGYTVPRRTVAKYRDSIEIPSSHMRKKLNMIKTEESL